MTTNYTPVDSSTIATIGTEGDDLIVGFVSNACYKYKGAAKLLEDFKNAESKGKYFAANIKKNFEYERLS